MGTVANIIVKNATLKVAAYGVAEGSAVDVGTLEGGVELEVPREYYDVTADAWLGTVAKIKVGEKMIIKCKMAESTLDNLALAFDYPTTAVATTTLTFGGDSTNTYRTLYINGDAPSSGTRKITLHKCVQTGSGAHAYKKGDKTIIEAEFEVIEDTSKTATERYGTIVDSSTDTTAPTVALTTPVDGGTVTQGTTDSVIWTITETNYIDENTIVYGDTFSIIDDTTPASAVLKAGTIVYNAVAKTVTFTPTVAWTTAHTFQAIVTTGLKDMAGNSLAAINIEQFSAT
ncbi:MAG TPA: hypothetical protein DCE80_14380 [Ignavibacteriales bacterium]|nr:hypothetical protein [Ignavibacteriales bacterium]